MARKKLNKSLVVALSLCAFAVMIFLSAMMLQRLAQRDPKYFVELAQAAAAQQQWPQAAVYYKTAYDRGNDPAYLVEFGEMLLQEGDVQSARIAWNQALIQDPTLTQGHIRQLTLFLRQARLYDAPNDWDAVRDAAQAMLSAVSEPDSMAMAHNALGLAMIHLRERGADADEGLQHLQKAHEANPREVTYAIDLAEELVRRNKDEEATTFFSNLVAQHSVPGPAASKIRTAYAQFQMIRGKIDEAESTFKQAVELAANDATARRQAKTAYAGFMMQRWLRARRTNQEDATALFQTAQTVIQDAINDDPKAYEPYIQLANLYRLSGEYAKVVDVCEKRIAQGLNRKGIEAAQNRLSAFTLMTYASEAAVALSVEAAAQGDFTEKNRWLDRAQQYVTDAKGEAPTHPMVLSQSGRVKIARGQEREGLEELRASDEAYKTHGRINWDNRLIRGRVHLQINEPGAAKAVMEEVLSEAAKSRPADPVFWNLYAQTLVQNGELERGLSIVERILASSPDDKDARRIKAAIFERQGKLAEAGAMEEQISGSPTVRAILEARAAALEGNTGKALEILREAHNKQPGEIRVVAALAGELAQLDRHDEAREVVNRALEADPHNESLRALALSLREGLSTEEREGELLRMIEAEEDEFKKTVSLVAFYLRKGDPAKGLAAIQKAEELIQSGSAPSAKAITAIQHAALLRTKLRAAAQVNDQAAMAQARDDAQRLNADGAGGKSLLGLYHFLRREFDLAAQAFQAALEEQPTHVSSWVMLGQCLQVLGRSEEAKDAYAKAAQVNPNESAAHQGLALLAQMTGDSETFEKELATAQRLAPDDPWVREQALIRQEAANPREAIARREQQLSQKEDAANLQRLAELYAAVGEKEKAEKAYSRLSQLLPDDARVPVAAATFHRKNANAGRAVEVLQQFMNSRKTPREQAAAATIVANEQFVQGNAKAAEETLLAADRITPTVEVPQALTNLYASKLADPTKAIQWLETALDRAAREKSPALPSLMEKYIAFMLDREFGDLAKAREKAAEFRRQFPDDPRGYLILSEVQARGGEIEQAISSLTDYLAKRPSDLYALTQRAQHLISQGRLQQAMADLEKIKQTAPAPAGVPARILLARIHEREGRRERALAEFESLAADVPGAPAAHQELISAYIRHKRFADADRIATGLINRAPEKPDPRWFFLRGQVSLEMKEADKALADFRRGAEMAGHSPAAVGRVLSAYAELGQYAQGAQYFEALGSVEEKDVELLGKYAVLLARAGRAEQAVQTFRKAVSTASTVSPQLVQNAMSGLLTAFSPAEAIDRYEKTPCPPELARANDRLLARSYAAAQRYTEAQAKLENLIQSAPSDLEKAGLLYEKGEVFQVAGDKKAALSAFEESLKFSPQNWYALNNVAYLLSEVRGQHEAALSPAMKAVALADNPYTLDTLGWIYTNLGRNEPAVAELSRALRLDPEYAISYHHLGETYRRMQRFDDAIQVLESGLALAKSQNQADLVASIEASLSKAKARDGAV